MNRTVQLLDASAKIARGDRQLNHVCPSVHPSVRLSVRMEQLGSHWKNFHEILYLSIFRKSVMKNQVSLKSDKNKGYFIQGWAMKRKESKGRLL
jgi:hypothetical protein